MTDTANTCSDKLFGTRAIAQYLGISERQAEHIVENRKKLKVPIGKMGRTVVTTRQALDEHFDRLVGKEAAAPDEDGE